jgi:hypothetical protein
MPFLREHFPHLVALYKARYADRAFLPADYGKRISVLVKKLCRQHGIIARDEAPQADHLTLSKQMNLFSR